MRLSDLIYEAGGLKNEAYLERAQLARTQIVDGARAQFAYIDVDLRAALEPQSTDDPRLLRGDDLLIQNASNWHAPWRASVVGEVVRPGPYPIRDGEHLSELLQECGGYKPNAFPLGAIFIRQSVRRLQQRELDDARGRLQTDMARLSLMSRPAGGTQPGADTLAVMQNVLAQNGSKQSVGRIAIQLSTLDALANSPDDVVLENQDVVIIPQRPVAVQVLGEVYSPNAIVYQPGLTVQDYLQRAGGTTEAGDPDHLYVVEADGEVLTDAGVRGARRIAISRCCRRSRAASWGNGWVRAIRFMYLSG
jgi:protein involved in polysaccharide export with SLBB domain